MKTEAQRDSTSLATLDIARNYSRKLARSLMVLIAQLCLLEPIFPGAMIEVKLAQTLNNLHVQMYI